MSLLLLLFLLLIGYLLWPLIRSFLYFRKVTKQMFSDVRFRNPNQSANSSNTPFSEKKKKIDKNIGEYVQFEEVSDDNITYKDSIKKGGDNNSSSFIEDQIEDIDWEEIS